jgi:pimeloyl-ACP methyl ester carboxylesterase
MIRKGYVDTRDGQLHYRRCEGGSGAPLALFHMTAASSEAYEGLMHLLDGCLPMIAFDTMNYGESYRTTREPSVPYIAQVMLEALSNLGIERFHTFGHHTGASIQAEMAAQSPERVLSAIMSGPTFARPEEMALFKDVLAVPNPISVKGTQFITAWSRIKDHMGRATYFGSSPRIAEIMHRDTTDMLRAGANWNWGYLAVFTHDLVATMQRMRCPMFFVCGRDDIAFPYHERAAAAYPDAAVYVHDESGVYYSESHADDLAPRLEAFIRSLE